MPCGALRNSGNSTFGDASTVDIEALESLAHERATHVARSSYGKLLAMLAARSGDLEAAEDALGDAFRRALEQWPKKGVPDRPEAWLFTVARNCQTDRERHKLRYPHSSLDVISELIPQLAAVDNMPEFNIPDDRLKLLFVCAHPAIDVSIRTALMLQTVLGIDADVIGQAFLISPSAMAQRLVRAKRKIRVAGIPFSTPQKQDLSVRLTAVLEAIYGAFAVPQLASATDDQCHDLAQEAIFLACLLAELMPEEPDAYFGDRDRLFRSS